MMQRMFTLLMVLGLVLSPFSTVFAGEEKKTLKELLSEKGVITKDEAADVQETKLSKWIDQITMSGDLRLREEAFMKDPNPDRNRFRFRLRFGPDIKISDFTVGIRLASGTGEQVSTNQTFDNLFSQKQIWIDRAYLKWQGADSRWLTLTGGRMPNPYFTVYSTDVVWDDDVNPEGFAENFNFKMGDLGLFLNMGQFVLDEDSTDNNDQYLFGEQVGANVALTNDVKTTLAIAYYDFTNTDKGNFGQVACQSGNTRAIPCSPTSVTNYGQLLNDYNVLDVTAQIGMKAGAIPVSLMGDYVKNMANSRITGVDLQDTGYQAGFILGKASDPHTWEVAYFYKVVETDATVADLSDSDFGGDGGTDRRGHIIWGAYNLTKYLQVKTKYFITKKESQTAAPSTHDDINRLQVDLAMKF